VKKMLHSKKGYPGNEFAQSWKDRCIKDGVPEIIFSTADTDFTGLPSHMRVFATRAAGDGSTVAKIIGLESLQPIMGDFGPREAREYKKQYITATMGADYVPAFLQDSDDADQIAGGASLAALENVAMQIGKSPLFSADNDQKAHFEVHLALGNNTIRLIKQQQLNAIEADKIFTVLVPHMAEHWVALNRSPFSVNFVDKMKKPWKELQEYAVLNRKNAESELEAQIRKQQQQQAQQQQVLNDEQLKNLKLQGDERRADTKVQSQVARAQEANQTRAGVMREKVQSDASNQRLKIQLEANNKTLEQQNNDLQQEPLPNLRSDLEDLSGQLASPDNTSAL
ncbi:MAG TPA: hypothetical protein VN457_01320, partial [Chlamydiales bacterium]|nr:hypothetical protein [Chlamydiales bacterium]